MSVVQSLLSQLRQGSLGQWYATKSPTDRLVIKIVAGLTSASVVYTGLWKPVSDYAADQQARYVTELTLSEWVALNQSALRNSTRQPSQGSSAAPALIPSITNAANQNRLKLDRLQPDSDGGVNITLQEQRFDHVLKWLTLLETKQGLSVERLSIDRGDKASRVSGQVKLVN